MKAFFGKLLFVLAIVGIIALGNLWFPNPSNDTASTAAVTETTAEPEPAEEPAAEPEEYSEAEPTE